jgi:predicted transposase YdaD
MAPGKSQPGAPGSREKVRDWKDKFAREIFGQTDVAIGFLKTYFPRLSPGGDWSALKKESGSFLDPAFKQQYSDLLFSIKRPPNDALIYFLFEHRSKCDRWCVLYLLRAMANIWFHWKAREGKGKKHLPVIIPIIFHQSTRTWTAPVDFQDLFRGDPELTQHVPKFKAKLVDLAVEKVEAVPDEQLQTILSLMLAVLKDKPMDWLLGQTEELDKINEKHPGPDRLMLMLNYLAQAEGKIDLSTIQNFASKIRSRKLQKNVMTWAESLKHEGRLEGRLEGRNEGLLEGEQKGQVKGQIVTLRELLSLPPLAQDELGAKPLKELERMARSLRLEAGRRFKRN